MISLFYICSAIAVLSTVMVVVSRNAVHALLYLIVSLLAIALVFFMLGAPFIAALEVIIYAGAIMVLFIFVIMMLNLGGSRTGEESQLMNPRIWTGPAFLCLVLTGELIALFSFREQHTAMAGAMAPKSVGIALLGPYVLGVELSSMLLLAGLVGAYHLGRPHDH